jgi:hypothetical protein
VHQITRLEPTSYKSGWDDPLTCGGAIVAVSLPKRQR